MRSACREPYGGLNSYDTTGLGDQPVKSGVAAGDTPAATSSASTATPASAPASSTRTGQQLDHLIEQVAGNIGVEGEGPAGLLDRDAIPETHEIRPVFRHAEP